MKLDYFEMGNENEGQTAPPQPPRRQKTRRPTIISEDQPRNMSIAEPANLQYFGWCRGEGAEGLISYDPTARTTVKHMLG